MWMKKCLLFRDSKQVNEELSKCFENIVNESVIRMSDIIFQIDFT